jgi:hypothetical protein
VTAARQVALVVGNELRMDFRVRGVGRERRTRNVQPFLTLTLLYALVGAAIGHVLLRADIPDWSRATLAYTLAGILVALHLAVEAQEILFAAADADILGWRPVASRTLFAARVVHILVYTGLLTTALVAVPSVLLAARGPGGGPGTWLAFAAGGWLHGSFVAALVVLVSGALLRTLPPERFQDVLGWAQIGCMAAMMLAYQLLTPGIVAASFGAGSPLERWVAALPAAWFAALPALAQGEGGGLAAALLGTGIVALGLAWAGALGRLGAAYQSGVEEVRSAAGDAPRRPGRTSVLDRLAALGFAGRPLEHAGWELLRSLFRADRRVRIDLTSCIAIPFGLVLAALVLGRGADPYRAAAEGSGFDSERAVSIWTATYMIPVLAIAAGLSLVRSADWRAAWVFYAAPLSRCDRISAGALAGVVATLLLPGLGLLALVLLAVWRDPLHVAAHLALPGGLAALGLVLAAGIDSSPPFSREPVRNARARELLWSTFAFVPMLLVAIGHYALRREPLALVLAGVGSAAVARAAFGLVARRARKVFPRSTFEA